jgi:hypothetical protein
MPAILPPDDHQHIQALPIPDHIDLKSKSWMQTYTGHVFDAFAGPSPEQIDIVDIAHSLSLQCRFNGHTKAMFSVAHHSLMMVEVLKNEPAWVRLWALLHDAGEAYVSDVPAPLKRKLPIFQRLEDEVMLAITTRYKLPPECPAIVKTVDQCIFLYEASQLLSNYENCWAHLEPAGYRDFWLPRFKKVGLQYSRSSRQIRKRFVWVFKDLVREINGTALKHDKIRMKLK